MYVSQVVDKNTKEAEIINQYVKNTHAATHNTYTLEVQEVSNYKRTARLFFHRSHIISVLYLTSFFHLLDLQNR